MTTKRPSGVTSPKVAKVAARELATGQGTPKQVRQVAGSDLRQKPGKKR